MGLLLDHQVDRTSVAALTGMAGGVTDTDDGADFPPRRWTLTPSHRSTHVFIDHGRRHSWVSASDLEHSS